MVKMANGYRESRENYEKVPQPSSTALSQSEKPSQTGAKTKSVNVDKSQLETPSVDEIRQGKRATLKDRCLRNLRQLSQALLAERLTGNKKSIFETAHPPNLTSAAAKRKWTTEEAKGMRYLPGDDDVLASSAMDPNSFHGFWLPARAKWRKNGEKDLLGRSKF